MSGASDLVTADKTEIIYVLPLGFHSEISQVGVLTVGRATSSR